MKLRTKPCWQAALLAAAVSNVLAQTAALPPAFEVAAIKPSMPVAEAIPLLRQGKLKYGMTVDKTRVDIGFLTIGDLMVAAYQVKPYQVYGPDWIATDRFDIQARMPQGANENQVPLMLQTLLADRFRMTIHREKRDLQVYELIVGPHGSKLKPSAEPDTESAPGSAAVTATANGGSKVTGGPLGPFQIGPGPNGMHMEMLRAGIPAFADLLTSILGRPVIDKTGLKGYYRLALDLPLEDVQNVARAMGVGAAGPPPASPEGSAPDPGGSSMFQAVEQLGLKLDSRRDQVDTIVIDRIERTPTGN